MKESKFLNTVDFFFKFALLCALSVGGSLFLGKWWGETGEAIGGIITSFALLLPFVCVSEQNTVRKNLKKALIGVLLAYVVISAFSGIGYLCNWVFGTDFTGIICFLIGLGIILAFNLSIIILYIIIRAIRNRNLTRL